MLPIVCYSDSLTRYTLHYCPLGVGWDSVIFIVDVSDVWDECVVSSREASVCEEQLLAWLPSYTVINIFMSLPVLSSTTSLYNIIGCFCLYCPV